ncbi:MAG: hypothetical protein OXC55_05980 [Chloroflexi bacterium]|nr:hypothetical protein [Chloroflexota bacterium]
MTGQVSDESDGYNGTVTDSGISKRRFLLGALALTILAAGLAAGCDMSESPTAVVREEDFYMTTVPVDDLIDLVKQLEESSADVTPLAEAPLDTFEYTELSDDEAGAIVRYVPEGVTLYQARVYQWPEGDWIYFRYGRIQLIEHAQGITRKLPAEFTETLTINGERAYLVRGWPVSVPGEGDEDRRWFWDESGRLALYFQSGDRTFEIDVLGGETVTGDEIIMMAESVNTEA